LRTQIVPCYITLDTAIIINLLMESGSGKGEHLANITKKKQDVWYTFFHTNRRAFKKTGYCFDYMIKTDGVACSILFRKKVLETISAEVQIRGKSVQEIQSTSPKNSKTCHFDRFLEYLKTKNVINYCLMTHYQLNIYGRTFDCLYPILFIGINCTDPTIFIAINT